MFHDSILLLQEGNKCLEMDKSSRFVNEQHFALHQNFNGIAMYQKLCLDVVTHDRSAKGNTKNETQTMISPFGKKADFDFKVSLVEGTIPSHSDVWNPWKGNGNSGMDAVSQANDIDKT